MLPCILFYRPEPEPEPEPAKAAVVEVQATGEPAETKGSPTAAQGEDSRLISSYFHIKVENLPLTVMPMKSPTFRSYQHVFQHVVSLLFLQFTACVLFRLSNFFL